MMKLVNLFLVSLLFCLTSCSYNKTRDNHILQKTFYSTGQLKEIISLNKDSIKDGLTTYFDTSGIINTTEEYKEGKLNGVKTVYNSDEGTYKLNYRNDFLMSTSWYDTMGVLKYKSPIDISKLSKVKIFFKNDKDYLDKNKNDTLRIVVEGLPLYNQILTISETTMSRIQDSDWYIIYAVGKHLNTSEIKLVVSYKNDIYDDDTKIVRYDSTNIPIK